MGNSESLPRTTIHPLLISVVLSQVFSNVDGFEDLKNIRLVCKLWTEMSLNQWRKSVVLRLSWMNGPNTIGLCGRCPPKALQTYSARVTLDIGTFLQFLQQSTEQSDSGLMQLSMKPFRNYRIQQCSLLHSNINEDNNFQALIRACGAHMEYLNLDHFDLYSDHYPELFNLLKELTNLKELKVILAPVERWGRQRRALGHDIAEGENLADPLMPLPSHALSLETVSMGHCGKTWKVGMPRGREWRVFFWYAPNLKNLTVDGGAVPLIRELKVPSITGQASRLSSLTSHYSKRDYSAILEFCRLMREYMDAMPLGWNSNLKLLM